jgi:hypothetical protein
MGNILESLYSHKNYFTERWVYDDLLNFVGSYVIKKDSDDHFSPFGSFEQLCIYSIIQKEIDCHKDKEKICQKVFEKREKRLHSGRHLPSLFVNDLIRSLTDAKLIASKM